MSQVRTKFINFHCTSKLSTIVTNKISFIPKISTLKMEFQQNSKRPTCPSCSKPLSLCLCTRLKTPNLDNKVHVTILQHSLERKHPLNSARIAKLGLKNVDVFTVTDVMFDAQFEIQPLGLGNSENIVVRECMSSVCGNASESFDSDGSLEVGISRKRVFDQVSDTNSGSGSAGVLDSEQNNDEIVDFDAENICNSDSSISKDAKKGGNNLLLSITIGKYGEIRNVFHQWKQQDEGKPPNLKHLLTLPEAQESLAGGFVVKKLQKKQISGSAELEQFEEFQITVPPGSALLFPAQKAVPIEAIDFEVKNLIVLDGTWAKANRMYNENPWLRLLPSVRLEVEKLSLFSEVRHQPKPGYLSTIESIVYALEALGESHKLEGLDNLLDVFESMVEDQRRYKDERLKKLSS